MSTSQVRRLVVVAMTALCGLLSGSIQAQTKVRFAEVARSLLFAPAYVAFSKGYFKDAGLDYEFVVKPIVAWSAQVQTVESAAQPAEAVQP